MYARKHDDFSDLLAEAAMENLFDTILTDDLFKPVEGFTPTDEERAKMEEAEKTVEIWNSRKTPEEYRNGPDFWK